MNNGEYKVTNRSATLNKLLNEISLEEQVNNLLQCTLFDWMVYFPGSEHRKVVAKNWNLRCIP